MREWISQIEREAAVLALAGRHLPVAVPDWEIATARLIAYPMLENKPVLVSSGSRRFAS